MAAVINLSPIVFFDKALLADGFVVHQIATEESAQQQAPNKKRKGLLGSASKLELPDDLEDDVGDFASLSEPLPNGPLLLEDVLAEEILLGRLRDGVTAIVDINEEGKVVVVQTEQQRELIPQAVE